MPRYQVEVTISGDGYLEVDAADEEAAKKVVRGLSPEIHFPMLDRQKENLDTSLFDGFADIRIDGVCKVEEE